MPWRFSFTSPVRLVLAASLLFPCAARATGKDTRRSLALIAVTSGEGISDRLSRTIEETLLASLDSTGRFKVVGRSDIEALLSLEAKKQAAGCTDTDCAIQIAGALGVDCVATADIGRLGRNTLITLKVIDVHSASVIARVQVSAASDDALPDAVRDLANKVVVNIWPNGWASPDTGPASAGGRPAGTFAATWVMFGVGAAAAIVAGVAGGSALKCAAHVVTPLDVQAAHQCEVTDTTIADVSWGLAGASAVTGGILLITWVGKSASPGSGGVAFNIVPNGFAVAGVF